MKNVAIQLLIKMFLSKNIRSSPTYTIENSILKNKKKSWKNNHTFWVIISIVEKNSMHIFFFIFLNDQ